jgi:hypothetical protein
MSILVTQPQETAMGELTPFIVDVPDAELSELKARLKGTRWSRPDPVSDWSRGVPLDYLREIAGYWATGFDWRAREAALNRLPQFTTEIEGQIFHLVHLRSSEKRALPLMLCHGWPGSFVEFERIIGPLVDPVAYGGKASAIRTPSMDRAGTCLVLPGPTPPLWSNWATRVSEPMAVISAQALRGT